ncbi:NAD(P)H-dependent flavin oxidoreductase [Pedomonas mirosovicensis]|uniref:NAD(P)H-dependent flavin oxidoreductase n=1 Tax=Pedomonas mirosovicensis TaxID=2908641 RepID=UPI002169A9F0|nr:nitronate monooxygenase [Pedomonas mirosovicensis]MCH8683728.1 nitronate monooxygenase [Pedomonas mirosovicensis]
MTAPATASGAARLESLMARGAAFFGSRYAILGGAMTWVSERNLVAAISNAGGFGVLASGAMQPERLREEIRATRALTSSPFGVNLITLHPQLLEMVDACIAEGVTHIVLAGGLPPGEAIERAKTGGAKVICFAPALALAKKLVRSGVDALVIEGSEAGGHIGPVSLTVLAQEILPHITDVPVFVAGGIGRGEAIASYLEMGAAGVQLGTRFVCATESIAHPNFKKAFIRASARDAIASVQLDPRFPVIPVRALKNQGAEEFMQAQRRIIERVDRGELDLAAGQLEIEHYWAGALRRAVVDGDVDTGSLMAGQSVGMVKAEQPVAEIVKELMDQAAAFLTGRAMEDVA